MGSACGDNQHSLILSKKLYLSPFISRERYRVYSSGYIVVPAILYNCSVLAANTVHIAVFYATFSALQNRLVIHTQTHAY